MENNENNSMEYVKNAGLASRDVKNKILKYLYSSSVNRNQKYEIIASTKDLDNIRDNDYLICPRFNGTRSWIMFFRINNYYYAVNFPKHSQRKKEDLRIHPVEISVNEDFYLGTIMEGIFFRMDEKKYLVIDEVYMLAGVNQMLKPKDTRMNNLIQYIKKNIHSNPNYQMFVSHFYDIKEKSLKELYEKIKSDPNIQEIIFYPKVHGRKIFSYTIIDSDLVDNVIKLSKFRMQKTINTDVYTLLTLSGSKVGIAYIPDMATSKKCKQWFKDYKCKELLVKCQMDMDQNLWIPLEIIEEDLQI